MRLVSEVSSSETTVSSITPSLLSPSLPHCLTLLPLSLGGCSSLGLSCEEMEASLATIHSMAASCGADMTVLRQRPMEAGICTDCLIRRRVEEDDFLEVR